MNPVSATLSVLLFMLICVLLEMLYSHYWKKNLYRAGEAFVNIGCGILERLMDILVFVLLYGVFTFIYDNNYCLFGRIEAEAMTVWMLLLLLLATDFCWYWYHRISHEVNVLWGLHIVHHQSRDYNLSVFFRATGLQNIVRIVFWMLLPLLGFPPKYCVLSIGILAVYQFFMHNQWIGRLGKLEGWLASPSHHRVHHAANGSYLDKNYAGLFAFYDRMFGTYQPEIEQPVYGVTNPYQRTNIAGVYFDYFNDIWKALRMKNSWAHKKEILFGSPEKMPETIKKNNVVEVRRSPRSMAILIATLVINAALLLIILSKSGPVWLRVLLSAVIIVNIIWTGNYLEKKDGASE